MPHESFRATTRTDWGSTDGRRMTHDDLKLGCLLRIADALEIDNRNQKYILEVLTRIDKRLAKSRPLTSKKK
jgi:hypothetical protein